MGDIELQMQNQMVNSSILTGCSQKEKIVIAKMIDAILDESPKITLSQLFFLLDQSKDFILANKTLKD